MKSAREKAAQLAELTGVSLGAVESIRVTKPAAIVPGVVGRVTAECDVTVRFAIRN